MVPATSMMNPDVKQLYLIFLSGNSQVTSVQRQKVGIFDKNSPHYTIVYHYSHNKEETVNIASVLVSHRKIFLQLTLDYQ